jgi:hypothetical protein
MIYNAYILRIYSILNLRSRYINQEQRYPYGRRTSRVRYGRYELQHTQSEEVEVGYLRVLYEYVLGQESDEVILARMDGVVGEGGVGSM